MLKKTLLLTALFCLIFLCVISKNIVISNDGPVNLSNYIKDRGYKIIEYIGAKEVIYNKKNLTMSDMLVFGLMDADIEEYIDCPLIFNHFVVTNHPLDNDFERVIETIRHRFQTRFPDKTNIIVVSYRDEIIGGFSYQYNVGIKLLGFDHRDIDGYTLMTHVDMNYDDYMKILIDKFTKIKQL